MKELKELESWADKVITNEAISDRPLPLSQDLMHQATTQYPDRSPEQALNLFVANKLQSSEKMDLDQNKLINAQKRENEKLRRNVADLANELQDHEKTAMDTEKEVQRLRDLSAKLKPSSQLQQDLIKVSQEQVQKMLSELESLKTKPGMDPEKFNELKAQIEKAKLGQSSSKEVKELEKMLGTLTQQRAVDDELFRTLSSKLQSLEKLGGEKFGNLEAELEKKEQRFKKSIARSAEQIKQWGNKYSEIDNKIAAADEHLNTLLDKIENADLEHANEKIDRLTKIIYQMNPELRQRALGPAKSIATSVKDVSDQDEVYRAMAANEPISGEEFTTPRQQSMSNAASIANRFKQMNEEVAGQVDEIETELIPALVDIYNNQYPLELEQWSPEQLKEIMRRSIHGSLLIFAPDIDEARIKHYLNMCHRWLRKTKPATPQLPEIPQDPPAGYKYKGMTQKGPYVKKETFAESLTREYQAGLDDITGGF